MRITECNGHCECNSEIEFFCHLGFDASHSEYWSQLLSCHEQITGLSEMGTVQRDGEQYWNIFEERWEASLINDLLCVCRFWVKMCVQSMKRQCCLLRTQLFLCFSPKVIQTLTAIIAAYLKTHSSEWRISFSSILVCNTARWFTPS